MLAQTIRSERGSRRVKSAESTGEICLTHRWRDEASRSVGGTTAEKISRAAAARLLRVSPSPLRAWQEAQIGPLPGRWGRYDCAQVTVWHEEVEFAIRDGEQVD